MLSSVFSGDITIVSIAVMIAAAIALGILNALVFSYKSFQTKSFSLTLALVPLVSSVIIFMVNDHLGVGVAVAGAFTLVRFRSIAGNGREIIAIFVSMALGLMLGMGYLALAGAVFIAAAALTLILTACDFGTRADARMLRVTVPEDLDYEGVFDDILERYTTHHNVERIRTRNMGTLYEITYSIALKDPGDTKGFIDEIRIRNGNMNVVLSSYADHDSI